MHRDEAERGADEEGGRAGDEVDRVADELGQDDRAAEEVGDAHGLEDQRR